jgi:hypothetical protein
MQQASVKPTFYQTTRRYNPEDSHLTAHRRENIKSCTLLEFKRNKNRYRSYINYLLLLYTVNSTGISFKLYLMFYFHLSFTDGSSLSVSFTVSSLQYNFVEEVKKMHLNGG